MGGKDSGSDNSTGSSDPNVVTDPDGTLHGNPDSGSFHIYDYDSWDWKHIELAILGLANGVDDARNEDMAKAVSDPQSLQDAADAFYQVQQVFTGVSQALADQGNALAGKDGVWKGDAADSFLDMIKLFSKQVVAVADVISGHGTSSDSVPQQLADNAVNLTNARNKISEIDNWYANQAQAMGIQPMSNGLYPISKSPQLVEWISRDMRAVLKSLANDYQVTVDSITSPPPVTSPLGGGGGGSGLPQPKPSDLPQPKPSDLPQPKLTDSTNPPGTQLGLDPFPTPKPGTGGPNDLTNGAHTVTEPAPFGGGTGVGGTGTIGGAVPPDLVAAHAGDFNPLDTGNALHDSLNPFDGGTNTGGTGSLTPPSHFALSAAPFDGGMNTGGTGSLTPPSHFALSAAPFDGGMNTGGTGSLDPASLSSPGAAPFGDGTGTDGTGKLGADAPLPGFGTGSLGSPVPLPTTFGGGTGVGGTGKLGSGAGLGTAEPDTWASSPAVEPFSGGLGVGGTGKLGSGLPSGSAAAFPGGLSTSSGLPGGLSSPPLGTGLPITGEAGAEFPGSLGTGVQGAGMPYLPGTGGGTAAQTPTPGGERSDASGLLGNDAKPWTGSTDVGDDMATHLGTAEGGEGLTLPTETTAPGAGMPHLPGTGGGTAAQTP
ncbi:WXG100 family type VII secretion target, partial [Kitasatospora sp. NPDC052896]|uniref:WXG100 family type VII secretion target n=1 Tax=Kitasatospora sp. NPDC052896 TaxID=3364061 RepID=UPI0037C7392D